MSFSGQNETGSFELITTTLRYNFDLYWNSSKTDGTKPVLISGEDAIIAVNDDESMESVIFRTGSYRPTEFIALDNSQGSVMEEIIIDVYAATEKRRRLFETECQRILEYIMPRGGSQIKKSDGVSNSAITQYSFPLPEFTAVGFSTNTLSYTKQKSSRSQMLLEVIWQRNYS